MPKNDKFKNDIPPVQHADPLASAMWDKTDLTKERIEDSPHYLPPDASAPYGYYQGRRLIGRDVSVIEGIYVGASEREAIVVTEGKTQNDLLPTVFREIQRNNEKIFRRGDESEILEVIFESVKKSLPTNERKVNEIVEKYSVNRREPKIGLEFFMRARAGVCRHQALLNAYYIEKSKQAGHLRGKSSVDRNTAVIPGYAMGGHAWERYTTPGGDIWILDTTLLDRPRRLQELMQQEGKWYYARPEDTRD